MKEDMSQRVHSCDNTFTFKSDSGCRIFTLSTCYVVVLKKKQDLPPRAVWELGIGEEVGGREGR